MFRSTPETACSRPGVRSSRWRSLLVGLAFLPMVHMLSLNTAGSAQLIEIERDEYPALDFRATAYCDDGITKSGVQVAVGMVAADPNVIPLGSIICVEETPDRYYDGIYQVTDTGRLVKGSRIDIYIPDLEEALEFGYRGVKVTVLRRGYPAQSPMWPDVSVASEADLALN